MNEFGVSRRGLVTLHVTRQRAHTFSLSVQQRRRLFAEWTCEGIRQRIERGCRGGAGSCPFGGRVSSWAGSAYYPAHFG
jgi:hypothetical protein